MRENKNSLNPFFLSFIALGSCVLLLSGCGGFKVSDDGTGSNPSVIPVQEGPDPFFAYAWHIKNTGQRVFASNAGTAGMDLRVENVWAQNIFGEGIHIRVSDDGVADNHPDLIHNFLPGVSFDYTRSAPYRFTNSRPKATSDNHGTAVTGLISAGYNNSIGSMGVAPLSKFSSANFLSDRVQQNEILLVHQASGEFDILNMSWGTSQNTFFEIEPTYEDELKNQVTNGRQGKGSVFVKASGNDFFVTCNGSSNPCVGNANMDPDATNPYTILVGALNAQGTAASYSSAGANIWISAFGGEDGVENPGIMTTDRPGCNIGYAQSSLRSPVAFEKGQQGNSGCRYTTAFGGTSAAAPQISGVVALLMQANPNLTWRDIKYILAKTARKIDPERDNPITTHPLLEHRNITLPAGYIWERPWTVNKANFHFHNWYGFGLVDVNAAVNLAQTHPTNFFGPYQSQIHRSLINVAGGLDIPDNSLTGASHTMTINESIRIESVRVFLDIEHNDISELAIELTSPQGTQSILMNMRNSLENLRGYSLDHALLTNAFYQEGALGDWTIKVIDGRVGRTGKLKSWDLEISGSPIP